MKYIFFKNLKDSYTFQKEMFAKGYRFNSGQRLNNFYFIKVDHENKHLYSCFIDGIGPTVCNKLDRLFKKALLTCDAKWYNQPTILEIE